MCLLKDTVDLLALFITTLYNNSLTSGMFPTVFKSAYITPRLKKASLDPADVKSYRPISNLPVLSKTLERLVAHQLIEHLNFWSLLPDAQSVYHANHSTETAVLRVMSGILDALNKGDFAVLTLLDLSAAFDTVDHVILLRHLKTTYGITHCTSLVHFLPPREKVVCTLQRIQFNSNIVTVWSSTRIGSRTDPVPSVRGRSTQTH